MTSIRRLGSAVFLVLCGVLWLAPPAGAEEQVTDEMLRAQFGKTHDVMREQRRRIQELMDGFLTGDQEAIRRNAGEISHEMSRVGKEFPPEEGEEAEVWKTMAGVTESARLLGEEAEKGDYQAAYQHFATMTAKCIACHQLRRDWGLFPEPKKQGDGADGEKKAKKEQ